MGHLGRITSTDDLPSARALAALVKEAMRLNVAGVAVPREAQAQVGARTPAWFTKALKSNPKAMATFKAFAPSYRRDYIEWLSEAKSETTRERRLATALKWLAEGKRRNWRYES